MAITKSKTFWGRIETFSPNPSILGAHPPPKIPIDPPTPSVDGLCSPAPLPTCAKYIKKLQF